VTAGGVQDAAVHAGADHVEAVQGGLGGDLVLVTAEAERGVVDLADEVLADLVLVDDLADPLADPGGAPQPARGHRGPDFLQVLRGGGEQFLAGAGPVGGQHRVVAADQPLAGIAGVADLGEVLGVEQAHLQRAVVCGQPRDGRGLQRGDPAHARQLAQVGDPGAGDHPPVADQDQALDAEVAADAGDGCLERLGVAGVADEHLDGDRAPFGAGEQPVFDLFAAAPAVAGVPERGQLAAAALHPGGGQVIHRDPAR
jgi:hypothetical protein